MSSFCATFSRSLIVGFGLGFDGFCRERRVDEGLAKFVEDKSNWFS